MTDLKHNFASHTTFFQFTVCISDFFQRYHRIIDRLDASTPQKNPQIIQFITLSLQKKEIHGQIFKISGIQFTAVIGDGDQPSFRLGYFDTFFQNFSSDRIKNQVNPLSFTCRTSLFCLFY
jgi:hypothetical protein